MPFVGWHRDAAGTVQRFEDHAQAIAAVRSGTGLTWIRFSSLTADDAHLMQEGFGFHALAVEDCVNPEYQRPKIDDFGDYLFLVLHGIDYSATGETVQTAELNLFVGKTWVVSATLEPMAVIEHLTELPPSADLLAYTLVDALVDGILPAVERMLDVADIVEEAALANPNAELLEHLIRLKRSVMRVTRVMGAQHMLLTQVSRAPSPLLGGAANQLYFRDVEDHLARIELMSHDLRERVEHAVATYHSALSIRQNNAMRLLAALSAIFLPLTLLVGIYGMNFDYMPELRQRWAYFVVLGIIVVVVAIGTVMIFGRYILGWGRDRVGNLASFRLEPGEVSERMREAGRLRDRVLASRSRRPPSSK